MTDDMAEIKSYLDEENRLKEWPSKRNKGKSQQLALEYMASKFCENVKYSEKEVNARLNQYHTFNDPAMLRREMVERKLLARMRDGSAYWRPSVCE